MGIPRAHALTSLSSFVYTLSDSGSHLLAFRSLPLGSGLIYLFVQVGLYKSKRTFIPELKKKSKILMDDFRILVEDIFLKAFYK